MNPEVNKGVRAVAYAIGSGLIASKTLLTSRKRVKSALDRIPWLDTRSRADVYEQADEVIRGGITQTDVPRYVSTHLQEIIKAFNRAKRTEWRRTKTTYVRNQMEMQRQRTTPRVFYLVSAHQKPQPAHEPLQGTVLVDRFWRTAVPSADRKRVLAYVRNHKTLTVQEAMGEPYYLITRPNCRHRLIPLATDEVLASSASKLRREHNKAPSRVRRPLSDQQRYEQYKELMAYVYARLKKLTATKAYTGRKTL